MQAKNAQIPTLWYSDRLAEGISTLALCGDQLYSHVACLLAGKAYEPRANM